jgi:glycosyltransferase involved in cell wall biosynthesis
VTGDLAAQTTVVLPVWDDYVGERLRDAVASLTADNDPARIVVVDNASEAELPELPRAVVVRSPRRLTLGGARNLGLAQVSTPYVVVWDADDVMLPGTLAFLEASISADPSLVAFGTAIIEDPSGARHRWPRPWVATLMRARWLFALLDCVWSLYPTTGATIMPTETVRGAGGYGDAESAEDWSLGVSLAFRGRIGWSERAGRVYRVHGESVWARHMTAPHLVRHARAIRERIRTDMGIASWARSALPLIAIAQYGAIAAHVGVAAARRRLRPRAQAGALSEPGVRR